MEQKYSGKQVIKAGDSFLKDSIFDSENSAKFSEAMGILSFWRFSHEFPLNTAITTLDKTCSKIDKNVIIAKRLKRHVSIVRKLRRFQDRKMKLKNMQDIGGCRAIIGGEKKLRQILRELKKKGEFKDDNGKTRIKDYIEKPKLDGYRGVHIIGKFNDKNGKSKNIEIQLRTRIQHYWATALEIIDIFTGQALKSNQGDINWESFFIRISEQFSIMEQIHLFEQLPKSEQVTKYKDLLSKNQNSINSCIDAQTFTEKLRVIRKLEAFSNSLKVIDKKLSNLKINGYVLLEINIKELTISTEVFKKDENEKAESEFINSEKRAATNDNFVVALVSTTAFGGIKEAYPNYFADSSEFLNLLSLIMSIKFDDSFWNKLFHKIASK